MNPFAGEHGFPCSNMHPCRESSLPRVRLIGVNSTKIHMAQTLLGLSYELDHFILEGIAMPVRKSLKYARWLLCILFGLATAIGTGFSNSVMAEDEVDPQLMRCTTTVSSDNRLIFEQWGTPGHCSSPLRTRVTDQFLGFTCLQLSAGNIACRSFIPRLDSRTFDTSKGFRCVEVTVTDGDGVVDISRLREWAAPPRQCDWDLYGAQVLAIEVDFEHSQLCLAAFCIDVDRLSAIGTTRMKWLITSAFKELNLIAEAPSATGVHPAYTDSP